MKAIPAWLPFVITAAFTIAIGISIFRIPGADISYLIASNVAACLIVAVVVTNLYGRHSAKTRRATKVEMFYVFAGNFCCNLCIFVAVMAIGFAVVAVAFSYIRSDPTVLELITAYGMAYGIFASPCIPLFLLGLFAFARARKKRQNRLMPHEV